jgi:hypothetical protein
LARLRQPAHGGLGEKGRSLRRVQPSLLGLGLLASALLLACPSERYTRPAGPAPRYESAPLAPWGNEATSEPGDPTLDSEIERATAADAGP